MAAKQKTEIVITADNKTARAFKEVQRSAKQTADDLSAMSLKMAGIAAVGIAAAGALFLLTKRALDNASALGDTAEKIGLNVESLQELRFAAEQAGVEQKTLDMAMQRFSRRVGEAVQGQGELKATLEQYGVAVTDAEGRTRKLDDVLGDYADAIANAGSEQEQLRLAFKGFDSEGAALVNMLRDGSEGLATMRREAQNLGLVLDEDAVRNADAASDALKRMERIISVNLQRVLIEFAPVIEQMGIAFAEAAPKIKEMADKIILFFFGLDAISLEGLKSELEDLKERWREFSDELGGREDLTERELAKVKKFAADYDEILTEIEDREKESAARRKLFEFGGGGAEIIDKVAEQERKRAEALLLAIEETNLQVMGREFELLDLRAEQELEKLALLHEAKTIDEVEYLEAVQILNDTAKMNRFLLEEEITEQHARELDKRVREEEKANRKIRRTEEQQARFKRKILTDLGTLMNSKSRAAFEIGKAAAIGGAMIDAFKAATGAYAALASIPYIGPALGAAAYAAALAAGFVQVQNIKSTSFGGGGGHGGSGGGGGGGSIPSIPDVPALAPPVDAVPVPTTVFINIDSESGVVTTEWIRDVLLPGLSEAAGDGFDFVPA